MLCEVCGFKFKRVDMRKRWDGLWVCYDDWEARHPMDYFQMPRAKEGSGGTDSTAPDTGTGGGTDVSGNTFPPSLVIDAKTFDTQTSGVAFNYQFTAQGAAPTNITWTLSSGSLPTGTALSPDGVLSGTITGSGTFTLLATSDDGRTDTESFTITAQSLSDIILATSDLWGYYPLQDDGSNIGGGTIIQETSTNNDVTPTHDYGNWGRSPSGETAPSFQQAGPGNITYGVDFSSSKSGYIYNPPSLGTGETYLAVMGIGIIQEFSIEVLFKRTNTTAPSNDSFIISHGTWIASGTPQPAVNASMMIQAGTNQFYHWVTPRTSGNALAGPIITDTDWHHCVITHSVADSIDEIYYDGSLYNSQTGAGNIQVYSTALTGGPYSAGFGALYNSSVSSMRHLDVMLSNAAFYRRRLTAAEVTSRWNAIGL